tara:strand:+ start:2664 stop:2834 length:171 start_codon:yes stop_codon:yes gene_type:complete
MKGLVGMGLRQTTRFVESLLRLKVRDFDRQVAEVQIRIAVMNSCTALGIPITGAVG